jgi:hypothetical protein
MKTTNIQNIIKQYLFEQHLSTLPLSNEVRLTSFGKDVNGWKLRIVGEKNFISNIRADLVDRRAVQNGATAGFLIVYTAGSNASTLDTEAIMYSISDLMSKSSVLNKYYSNEDYQIVVGNPIVNTNKRKTINCWIINISKNTAYGQLLTAIEKLYSTERTGISYQGSIKNLFRSFFKDTNIITQTESILQKNAIEEFLLNLKNTKPDLYTRIFPSGDRTKQILNSIPRFEEMDKQFVSQEEQDAVNLSKTGILSINDIETNNNRSADGEKIFGDNVKIKLTTDPITGMFDWIPVSGQMRILDTYTNKPCIFDGIYKNGAPEQGIILFDTDSTVVEDGLFKRTKFEGKITSQLNETGVWEAWLQSGTLYLGTDTDEKSVRFVSTENGFSKKGYMQNGTIYERDTPTSEYKATGTIENGKYKKIKPALTYPYTMENNTTAYTLSNIDPWVYVFSNKLWTKYDKTEFENRVNYGGNNPKAININDRDQLQQLDAKFGTTSVLPLRIKSDLNQITIYSNTTGTKAGTYKINPPEATRDIPNLETTKSGYIATKFNNKTYWVKQSDVE